MTGWKACPTSFYIWTERSGLRNLFFVIPTEAAFLCRVAEGSTRSDLLEAGGQNQSLRVDPSSPPLALRLPFGRLRASAHRDDKLGCLKM